MAIQGCFNSKQQAFLDFVLAQYVKVGVEELDREKLPPLLKLRYQNAIADAVAVPKRPAAPAPFWHRPAAALLRTWLSRRRTVSTAVADSTVVATSMSLRPVRTASSRAS